jgi:hypothetical protein
MMLEAVSTSETSAHSNETTRRYIPQDSKLHTCLRENLNSHVCWVVQFCNRRIWAAWPNTDTRAVSVDSDDEASAICNIWSIIHIDVKCVNTRELSRGTLTVMVRPIKSELACVTESDTSCEFSVSTEAEFWFNVALHLGPWFIHYQNPFEYLGECHCSFIILYVVRSAFCFLVKCVRLSTFFHWFTLRTI